MTMIMSKENEAIKAYTLVKTLQKRFVDKLNILSQTLGENKKFEEVTWLRDKGIHGGGSRFEARDKILFNTASINISQVHYNEDNTKKLQSASAISTIIHPKNPNAPSIHIHISLTKLRNSEAYWRIMADLNPTIINEDDKKIFNKTIEKLSGSTYEEGVKQGNKYFNIPALNKHRGISHFYLENYRTSNKEEDSAFALRFAEAVIDTYINIINNAFRTRKEFSIQDIKTQLNYHTLYLFQVLTLDRGTTSGLLIHSENDLGIMGSLPTFVNKKLLKSWANNIEKPQDELVRSLANALNTQGYVDIVTKEKLASIVREHYKKYPEALNMQASGNTIPYTVSNYQKK